MFLKISHNSQESSCAGVSFFCNFNEKEALTQVVSCEFCKIFQRTIFTEQLRWLLLELYSREPIFIPNTDGIVDKQLVPIVIFFKKQPSCFPCSSYTQKMHWGRSWLAIFKGGSVDAWRYNGEKLNPGNLRFTKKQTYGNK